ncbi:MAG: hypothetical protein JWO91_1541 [Acidobacteriaceae bacterium]|nr:hypothetical protein [Acidobacteriaceae bacterium]
MRSDPDLTFAYQRLIYKQTVVGVGTMRKVADIYVLTEKASISNRDVGDGSNASVATDVNIISYNY